MERNSLNIAVHSKYPATDRINLMFALFVEEAETFFENCVADYTTSANKNFQRRHNHFHTTSFIKQKQTRLNKLKFSDMAKSYPSKNMTDILNELVSQSRDMQTLLGHPYTKRRCLKDFLESACDGEKFIDFLSSDCHTQDPDEHLERLHKCIDDMQRRPNRISKLPVVGPPSANYDKEFDELNLDEDIEYAVYCNRDHQPKRKRHTMRSSSLFYTPRYPHNSRASGNGPFPSSRPSSGPAYCRNTN